MAHRHKVHRAKGGSTMTGRKTYVPGNVNVEKEGKFHRDRFKHGGISAHGHKSKARADKRARGGPVTSFPTKGKGGNVGGTAAGHTKSPFSSAARSNDMGRFPKDRDHQQPYARGGRTKHAGMKATHHTHHHAGGGREGFMPKHPYNYGHHHGSGHEEGIEHHLPVHHSNSGKVHGFGKQKAAGGAVALKRGGRAHHAGHGAHKAFHPHHDGHHEGHHSPPHHAHGGHHLGKRHRAHGGKVDKEED